VASGAPDLLLLIPAYNEEKRIEPVLREYANISGSIIMGDFRSWLCSMGAETTPWVL